MSRPIAQFTYPNVIQGHLLFDPDQSDTTQFGVYSTGTAQLFPLGTIFRQGDRAFRYGRAGAAVKGGFGAGTYSQYKGITGGNVTARAIGDDTVDILCDSTTGASTWFGTADLGVGSLYSQPDSTNSQFRMVIGHEVAGTTTSTIWLTLDGPITRTMVAASFTEMLPNPYYDLRKTTTDYTSVMGVPTTVIASGSYGWFQTWGPAWMNPNQPVSDAANRRQVCFKNDGAVWAYDDATGETGHQLAGFTIDRTGSGSDNPPFIFLQINP